ncbi:hypothetical protein VNI00_002875 [Paramarasmius palmivorus]|uniref:Uncharacterized protein n=1 Tax=Paramarasmius palmivorus TaxID=297713 RepID=A0AAW0DYG5_9AGAR
MAMLYQTGQSLQGRGHQGGSITNVRHYLPVNVPVDGQQGQYVQPRDHAQHQLDLSLLDMVESRSSQLGLQHGEGNYSTMPGSGQAGSLSIATMYSAPGYINNVGDQEMYISPGHPRPQIQNALEAVPSLQSPFAVQTNMQNTSAYAKWTRENRYLYAHRNEIDYLSSVLGRGLPSVSPVDMTLANELSQGQIQGAAPLQKIQDQVSSPPYNNMSVQKRHIDKPVTKARRNEHVTANASSLDPVNRITEKQGAKFRCPKQFAMFNLFMQRLPVRLRHNFQACVRSSPNFCQKELAKELIRLMLNERIPVKYLEDGIRDFATALSEKSPGDEERVKWDSYMGIWAGETIITYHEMQDLATETNSPAIFDNMMKLAQFMRVLFDNGYIRPVSMLGFLTQLVFNSTPHPSRLQIVKELVMSRRSEEIFASNQSTFKKEWSVALLVAYLSVENLVSIMDIIHRLGLKN